ncbi:MAG: DUF4870 domain-containing protein [Chthoniobacterales bacterium]
MNDSISSTPPPSPSSGLTSRNWCTIIHASGFLGTFTGCGHIIAPLIIWLIKKTENPEIDAAGRNVLNFQISYTIYFLIAFALVFVFIGFLILPVVGIAWFILIIVGTVKSSNGIDYKYPLTIKFL